MRAALIVMLALWALSACSRPSASPLGTLLPLSPRTHEFDCDPKHRCRIDFFFVEAPTQLDQTARQALRSAMLEHPAAKKNTYHLYSVYVYRRGTVLNEAYVDDGSLRGAQYAQLLAYARWRDDVLDMHSLIDHGEVVFDLMTNEAVDPPWEFQ